MNSFLKVKYYLKDSVNKKKLQAKEYYNAYREWIKPLLIVNKKK